MLCKDATNIQLITIKKHITIIISNNDNNCKKYISLSSSNDPVQLRESCG